MAVDHVRPGSLLAGPPLRAPGTFQTSTRAAFAAPHGDEKPAQLQRTCMGDSATFGLSNGGRDFRYTPTYSGELQRLLSTDDAC